MRCLKKLIRVFFLPQTTKKVVQFQSVEQPNGGIKEVCLTKDSYGNSEKITTRIIGDKVHSIRETTDFQGYLELEERCENFDEGFLYISYNKTTWIFKIN